MPVAPLAALLAENWKLGWMMIVLIAEGDIHLTPSEKLARIQAVIRTIMKPLL